MNPVETTPRSSREQEPGALSGGERGSTEPHSEPAPASQRPPPPRVDAGGVPLPDERPAREHVSARSLTLDFQQRAEWLESEAKQRPDSPAKARLLLAASEIRALLGETAEARRLALAARSLAPDLPLSAEQARGTCQTREDWVQASRELASTAASKSPRLAAHEGYLAAEIARLKHKHEASADADLVEAAKQDPSSARIALLRLIQKLARQRHATDFELDQDQTLPPLGSALEQLRQLRGGGTARIGVAPLAALSLADARDAAGRGDQTETAGALAPLASRAGLRDAICWLESWWLAAPSEPAGPDLMALRRLVQASGGRLERRALAARALKTSRPDLLLEALDESGAAFSAQERTALLELGTPARGLAQHLDVVAGAEPRGPRHAELAFGLEAASVDSATELDARRFNDLGGSWSLALELDSAAEAADAARLSQLLWQLPAQPAHIAEAHFAAGVLSEQRGDLPEAQQHYQAAQLSNTTREAATRALARPGPEGAAAFRSLSAHARDPQQRSLLLAEVLLRSSPEVLEFDALAEAALRADPELPFAYQLGELAARIRGERGRVERWLARQREFATGPREIELRTVREALFHLETDAARAAQALDSLPPAGTADLMRQLVRESLGDISVEQRAVFRERLAAASTSHGRAGWTYEAIELHAACGRVDAALSQARQLSGPAKWLWLEALATTAEDRRELIETWARLARETRDADVACGLYDRASRLVAAGGDLEAARQLQRSVLTLKPDALSAWHWLELDSMAAGREAELLEVARGLLRVLDAKDAAPYVFVAARLAVDRAAFADLPPLLERASSMTPVPLWALRLGLARARSEGDDRQLLGIYEQLRERALQPLDVAVQSLRAAEAAARLGQGERARREIERAYAASPDNVVILSLRSELLAGHDDGAAARAAEELARASNSPQKRADALYQAALLWFNTPGERARGEAALAAAAQIAPPRGSLAERLRHIATTPAAVPADHEEERTRSDVANLELSRALALLQNGKADDARSAIEALLERDPRHLGAHTSLAELELQARDWPAAEQTLRRVIEAAASGGERSFALRGLLRLYRSELADRDKARSICLLLLADDPDDHATREILIEDLIAGGELVDALDQQRELLARAPDDQHRRKYLLDLAELVGRQGGDGEAAQLLERARRTWPESPEVLAAEVNHHRRRGDHDSARLILDRAITASRNAVRAGRLELELLQSLELGTRLSGDPHTARAAQAAQAALRGESLPLPGAGPNAGQTRFDDLLAPSPLSSGFRRLLYGAGAALERAYAVDPSSLGAAPLAEPLASEVRAVAHAFGLKDVRVAISDRVGCDCVCVSAGPVYVLMGAPLVAHEDVRLRDFLLFRALKIAQANACAMSRLPPPELWAAVAGFMACFSEAWPAEGADAQRLLAARNRIRPHITATLSPELQALTAAVTSSIVPRAAQLGDALWRWASRVALLGVGDLGVALEGLSTIAAGPRLPKDVEGRVRWIASNSGARDLVGYGVSEAYTEARRRAGLDAS